MKHDRAISQSYRSEIHIKNQSSVAMRSFFYTILLIVLSLSVKAQTGNYYVSGSALNLRTSPDTQSEILHKFTRYDNLEVLEQTDGWAKINYQGKTGYVSAQYITAGKAVVSSYEVRVGAKCKDGTSSSATGRGACSHHGGVSYWKTKTKQEVQILK